MRINRHLPLAVPICISFFSVLLVGYIFSKPASSDIEIAIPLGLPPLEAHQRPVKRQVELGRKLFFDRRLAFNNTNSCAMCHIETQGLTSNQSATAIGMEGRSLNRNAPALYNVAYEKTLFHDGRETDLAQQAWSPLLSSLEMANPSIGSVVDRIRGLEDYKGLFETAFDERGVSMETIGAALASYQRTLLAGNSRFDQWYYGKKAGALSDDEKHGFEVFAGKGSCATCHTIGEKSALFTDGNFYVTGIGYHTAIGAGSRVSKVQLAPGEFVEIKHEDMETYSAPRLNDIGRFAVTLDPKDRWSYKTPGLRNVELTFPYMHDGSLSTLEDVVEFYDKGGYEHDGDRVLQPLGLTAKEKADLVAFLKSLTTAEDKAKHSPYR
ncbi:MAG: cytochrome C peroxidase [Proteobacteria bacterium]|nr:cytochrome C peroxidase [Pseudomonadota bacterium]